MKVICDRGALLNAITLVSGVVATRTPRPQLTCVKLSATKEGDAGSLRLLATDAEISLQFSTDQVDVEQPGEALIPADKIRAIVSAEDTEPTISIESEGDSCLLKAGRNRYTLMGYPPGDFPPLPSFATVVAGSAEQSAARMVFEHDAGSLDMMVARTAFATARENSRYAINGVLLVRDGKQLQLVATDGRRLARCATKVKGTKEDASLSSIVPTKALSMLQKLIDDPDEPVKVAVTENQIFFCMGGDEERAVLSSNLVEGTFPPYEEVIPKDQDKKVVFDRDVLSSAVRRAALLTNEESRGVRLTFSGDQKQLELSSRAPEMGEAQISVDVVSYDGEDIVIGFNPQFIIDALKVFPDEEVILELKSANKPGLIRAGNDFHYVVMPVST